MLTDVDMNKILSCSATVGNVVQYVAYFVILLCLCHGLHLLLRSLSQPRLISETLVGLILGNTGIVNKILHTYKDPGDTGLKNMESLTDFGMSCYMYALGLDMDPSVLMQLPKKEAIVAYVGMFSTFILACGTTPYLHYAEKHITSREFILVLARVVSSSGSPLLTRVLTDLKIGKSDIGKFAVSAAVHTELVATLLICIGNIVYESEDNLHIRRRDPYRQKFVTAHAALPVALALLVQIIVAIVVGPIVFNWINHENAQGKTLKGPHLVLSVAFVVVIGCISPILRFNPVISAFVTGIFLPREGRISKFMITKANYLLSFIFYPFFFVWVGVESEFGKFEAEKLGAWLTLFGIFAIGLIGKIVGTVLSWLFLGIQFPESIVLGLLLDVKGHLHMYLAIVAKRHDIISSSACIGMILAMLLKIIYIPLVAVYIINRAKKRSPNQKMALQWHNPSKELRILLCLHGPENVPSAINLMELSKGMGDPGLVVYATDMVELTNQIAATLVPGEGGVDKVTVTDKAVVQMRQGLEMDRTSDGGPEGYRYVNRKVLRNAPCSVAVLLDCGLGTINITKSEFPLHVAVIFIGGKDDREALAYASYLTHNPSVKVTVVRFLMDTEKSAQLGSRTLGTSALQEAEMKLDDECFANFYELQIAGGRASYMEKHLVNSPQAYSTLRSLEGQYGLFIVGCEGRVNSALTVGMNDWEQCPELGPLGDILSSPNFSTSALIIQQHNYKGLPGGADNEFSIM